MVLGNVLYTFVYIPLLITSNSDEMRVSLLKICLIADYPYLPTGEIAPGQGRHIGPLGADVQASLHKICLIAD